ncbi:MAG: hypothetical protein GVY36_04815 [Verrucomicrobia bacterium]|jgi:peptide methionine sulfoxide reductase MsrA|nr:hypothetical protein [Verrucomicrobiota bacterium]
MEETYFAGGCLWGAQEFLRHLPGVVQPKTGRANGSDYAGNSAGASKLAHHVDCSRGVSARFKP